ncbi:TraR/DksA family transcriptional regulator [soil metagenome]
MARNDALKKLQKTLSGRRNELRRRLKDDLSTLSNSSSPDTATQAAASQGEELASQLAVLESRELAQIDAALVRLKQGKYGECAGCECKIPVGRLTALPYSTLCIACQREVEKDPYWLQDRIAEKWGEVNDGDDREVNLADIEFSYSK